MTKKYKNEWDVHVRDAYDTAEKVVRVEGSWHRLEGGYLTFEVPTEDTKGDYTVTALFPHQNVAKVVRVEDEDSEPTEFTRGYTSGYELGYQNGQLESTSDTTTDEVENSDLLAKDTPGDCCGSRR